MEAHPVGHVHPYVMHRASTSLGHAERAVFEADATRELYERYLMPGAGEMLPYGVDFDEIDRYRAANDRDAARSTLDVDEDSIVVLCLGTIEPRKAQVMLTQAFAGVDVDRDVRLVLAVCA